jgi:enoyl-CoA hydratase/carnithine racemase
MLGQPEILFRKQGNIGLITLNRPKVLNALTHSMASQLHAQLIDWSGDASIGAVVIEGAGDKGFCAGGDVVALYNSGKAWKEGDARNLEWRSFFRDEYRMNAAIHHFNKPYIALMDGITMGGGVGVSVHGSHRVASERTMLAMPETGLGLFPDVGGGYFLPRLPGATGMFLALKGERVKAADCVALGICQSYVPSNSMEALKSALSAEDVLDHLRVTDIITSFSQDAAAIEGEAKLAPHQADIDRIFAGDSLQAIMVALESEGSEWAVKQITAMAKMSPTSMAVSFRQIRAGGSLSFDDVMRMEFRIVNRIMEGSDFYEGVRAILLDKDFAPRWQPARLDEVSDDIIAHHFDLLGDGELEFDPSQ